MAQLQASYQAAAKTKGFTFDPQWEAAIQEYFSFCTSVKPILFV
jgi:hypothetical protein